MEISEWTHVQINLDADDYYRNIYILTYIYTWLSVYTYIYIFLFSISREGYDALVRMSKPSTQILVSDTIVQKDQDFFEKWMIPGVRQKIYKVSLEHYVVVVQLLSHVCLFATPWTAAHQDYLSITNFCSLLNLMSIKLVMQPAISSSVITFSSCLQSFPASGSFPKHQFFS